MTKKKLIFSALGFIASYLLRNRRVRHKLTRQIANFAGKKM